MGALNLQPVKQSKLAKNVYCSFLLGDLEIALQVEMIQEVVNYPEALTPVPLSPDYILGIFNLRGTLIPIANMHTLLKSKGEAHTSSKIVIVNYHEIKIGLLFDSTNEILKVTDDEVCKFDYNKKAHAVVAGALKLDGGNRIIQIVAPEALIHLDQIPHIVDKVKLTDQSALKSRFAKNQKREQCISFMSQDVALAVKMDCIFEILKVSKMEPGFVNYDYSLGLINLRGSMVPIVNLAYFLKGEGSNEIQDDQKIVIIQTATNTKLGLLVDSVDNIISYQSSELLPISSMGTAASSMYSSVLHSGEKEILLLDEQILLTNEEIHNIVEGHAKLFKEDETKKKTKKKLIKEVFISFKIAGQFLLPILEIQEIVNFPTKFINPPGVKNHILGLMNLREHVITVVDMRDFYHLPKLEDYSMCKILIVHHENERYGLVVDGVDEIVSVNQEEKASLSSLMTTSVEKKLSFDTKEIAMVCGKDGQPDSKLVVLDLPKMVNRIRGNQVAAPVVD